MAPEQTEAGLEGEGAGSGEPEGVATALGTVEAEGLGPLESDRPGESALEVGGPTVGLRLWTGLVENAAEGALEAVPRPHPASTSSAAKNRESRTVPAVRGRMAVTRQA